MFDKIKYMNYIETLENQIKLVYIVILVIAILVGIATAFIGLIVTVPLRIIICEMVYSRTENQNRRNEMAN